MILDADPIELGGDDLRGSVLLEAKLRMRVQIAPELGQCAVRFADLKEQSAAIRSELGLEFCILDCLGVQPQRVGESTVAVRTPSFERRRCVHQPTVDRELDLRRSEVVSPRVIIADLQQVGTE